MKITSNPNDRHLLVAGASALAFVAWVVYEPTAGFCNSFGIFLPIWRITIFIAWLIYICHWRAKINAAWNWKNFAIGAFTGGGIIAIALVVLGLHNYYSNDPIIYMETLSIQRAMQPLVYTAPYMAVAGMYAAFSQNSKSAAISGGLLLLAQCAADSLLWIMWTCVY